MKLLKCKLCRGECDIINNKSINLKIKCRKCGFTNENEQKTFPEVIIIRKKNSDTI